jgi:hypothetical protein
MIRPPFQRPSKIGQPFTSPMTPGPIADKGGKDANSTMGIGSGTVRHRSRRVLGQTERVGLVTNVNPTAAAIIGAVVTLALIAAVAVLTWHGDIDGQAAIGFFAGLGGAGAAGIVAHSSTKAGARAATRRE